MAFIECSKDENHPVDYGNFCTICGAPTKVRECAKCGHWLGDNMKFCGECGANVEDAPWVNVTEARVNAFERRLEANQQGFRGGENDATSNEPTEG